jgi:F-type H+-transporting ATPase subunit c
MKKVLHGMVSGLLSVIFLILSAPVIMAAEEAALPSGDYTSAIVIGCSVIAAGLVMGLGALGAGPGMGQATSGAANAVGRNPDAHGKIMLTMLVGMAMTESIAIYTLVIALVVLYANPLLKYIFG